jgi:hypothetical protein
MRGIALSSLASIVMLSLALQTATPPHDEDPHAVPNESQTTDECAAIIEYTETLFATIDDHGVFSDFWLNGDFDTVQQQDRDDIRAIVEDGQALLEDLEKLDVPDVYQRGNDGIIVLFGYDIGYITFLGIDASTVPDLETWDRGLALVLAGELGAANKCPDEIEEVGGYIFFPIDELEDALEQ